MRRGIALGLLLLALLAAVIAWLLLRDDSGSLDATPAGEVQIAPTVPTVTYSAPPPAAPEKPRQTVENAVLASGMSIRIVRRARIGVPNGSYAESYRRLDEEAKSGNKVSEYQLGLLLYECREVPADAGVLEQQIEALHQTRHRGGFDINTPADEERELRRQYQQCDQVPAGARLQFRDHLKAAADAGVLEAQINLPLKLPPAEYCQYLSECSPAQRAAQEALQQEAIDYLGRARDAGSASTLWTFGAWYAEGEVLPKNEVEAYANFSALDQINAATHEPQRFAAMLAGMKKRLRPVDLDQAEARSKEILSNPNCCVITP